MRYHACPAMVVSADLAIRACSAGDLARLERAESQRVAGARERFARQQRGEAVYLLAWRGERFAGHGTLLARSKYDEVRGRLGELPELNALATWPRNQGTGTRLIGVAEAIARDRGAPRIGLAVEHANVDARRLYLRLGYMSWGHGTVIDEWLDPSGEEHADHCDYLVKQL